MKKHIHAACFGLFIIYFIGAFNIFTPKVLALALAPHFCCSSVAFIPGLEGSRLYTGGLVSENQLWEPNRNADVEKLYLDANGKSLNSSIYTRDIINGTNYPAYNIDIYQSFSNSMDALVSNGTISSWETLPYDWRLDYNDIIANGVKTSPTATSSLVKMIQDLAANSKTGKVTLVAHSNGGLLAKSIIDELVREGKDYLIDNLVLVAVPQLGTPESIPAILHGYGQDLARGLLLNSAVARNLGKNMPTAYNLLPSQKYLDQNTEPFVTFDSSIDSVSSLRTVYGNSIDDSAKLTSFFLGTTDHRTITDPSDVSIPNILNSTLLSTTKSVHATLDNWTAPPGITVSQIVGWGLDTVSALHYQKKTISTCIPVCADKDVLDYRPVFDFKGDGVVMKSSADAMSASKYYVNLAAINIQQNTNRAHGDILETDAVQTLIKNILTGQQSALPDNVVTSLADDHTRASLQVSIHSPVLINLYDVSGNHTGPIANADQTSDIDRYEAKIPNSYYLPFGEGVYAGVDTSATTTIALQGTGVGSFTLEVNGKVFQDLPVLPTTIATVTASAATTSALSLDLNGDGKTDMTVGAGQDFDPIAYLQGMESVISTFNLTSKIETQIDKKIDNLITQIKKGKISKVDKRIQQYLKSAKLTKKHKKITADDQNTIIVMLNTLLDNLN